MTVDQARNLRTEMVALTERLIAEFDRTPAGRVIAVVTLCRHQLAEAGLHGDGLVYATESMARTRMSQAA
jgi:hypothetical protein